MSPGRPVFEPPEHWRRLQVIDAHAAGEPLRVVVDGYPELPGATILDKRRLARERFDSLRRALMLEPRGHADMYGAILTEPVTDDGDAGVLFLHNEGYSTMCGHGIIAVTKVALDLGLLSTRGAEHPLLRFDTPAGRVTARAELDEEGRVDRVSFVNVPSFVVRRDLEVEVPGLGRVVCDVAFGGAFYAILDAAAVGLEPVAARYREIVDTGIRIKAAVIDALELRHPSGDADLGFLYGTILVGPPEGDAHSRNVCIFADGEVDRSPTGTGISARAALLHERGELAVGDWITVESVIGTTFDVRVVEATRIGDRSAVVPEVRGRAFVTGRAELWVDPDDPLRDGVLLR